MRRAARATALAATVCVLAAVAAARAEDDSERVLMGRVRLTTEPAMVRGCARLGTISDDSVKDLRRKVVRSGGDAALLSFGAGDEMSRIYAEVYRCPTLAPVAPAAPVAPGVPPPPRPPGTPPPPPPAGPAPPPPPATPR
jgi:hypothetical protein